MAKIIQAWLISLLIIEAAAALWLFSAQKFAELSIKKTELIRQDINAWETTLTKEAETRNGLLQLAYLSWQIYEDNQAKAFWQRAFYLDPGFVTSLPVQLF